jgi:hypothetical protein
VSAEEKHPRTAAAVQARRQNTQAMLRRVQDAITVLHRQKTTITYLAVARRAAVSRTFLYENPDARHLVTSAIAQTSSHREHVQTEQDAQLEASWRERALNAEEALKTAHTEIRGQRTRIGQLMGQIRDLEQQWSHEDIQRITSENTTLKQRVRQLTQDNRTLEERLGAARENGRFADRRISQLEAQLLEQPTCRK